MYKRQALGAVCTGRPIVYLVEAWRQAFSVIGLHATQSTMVSELRPTAGNWFPLLLMGGLLVLRQLAKLPARPFSAQPAFWLSCMGWVLGFQAERFWDDWGPVSYTHLVAYLLARTTDTIADTQIVPIESRLDALSALRRRILGRGGGALPFSQWPVSYTHLDVYKRQPSACSR